MQFCADIPQERNHPRRSRGLMCLWDGQIIRIDISYFPDGEFNGFFYHDEELAWHVDQRYPERIKTAKVGGYRVFHTGKFIEVKTQIVDYKQSKYTPLPSKTWHKVEPDGMYYSIPTIV